MIPQPNTGVLKYFLGTLAGGGIGGGIVIMIVATFTFLGFTRERKNSPTALLFGKISVRRLFKKILYTYTRQKGVRGQYSVSYKKGDWLGYGGEFSTLFGGKHRIYWDTRYGVVLQCDGHEVAGIGFEVEGDMLVIEQIQGVRGCGEVLSHIRWERLLTALVVELARVGKYKEVAIITGSSQRWCSSSNERALKCRHDGTARKMKFKFNPETLLWKLPIAAT